VRSPQLDLPEPFRLTPQEQATLDLVLRAWQERSGRIKTLKCAFTFRKYEVPGQDPTWQSEGRLSYIAPDKGEYEIPDEEHWICDGKSIFEFNFPNKQLIERPLPPEMQGKAITNGPLPFVFGTTADALHRRYSMRVIPDQELPEQHEGQVWLEARPRFRQDAANFRSVTVILDDRKLLPVAVEQVLPNGNRTSYVFRNVSVNYPLDVLGGLFKEPRAPRGWQRVIERPPLDESQLADPPAQPRQQAGHRRVPLR
jgi:TIGR03009 family protein